MIIGAQKAGTTALASFLSEHPDLRMSRPKEVHLFNSPEYSPQWSVDEINARYRPCFPADSTPVAARARSSVSVTSSTRIVSLSFQARILRE